MSKQKIPFLEKVESVIHKNLGYEFLENFRNQNQELKDLTDEQQRVHIGNYFYKLLMRWSFNNKKEVITPCFLIMDNKDNETFIDGLLLGPLPFIKENKITNKEEE